MSAKPPLRRQFSIKDMMVGFALFAFGCAALKGHSRYWASTTVTGMLVLLTIASFGARYRAGRIRAFRAGFAITAGACFLMPYLPSISDIHSQLLTTQLFEYLGPYVRPDGYTFDASGNMTGVYGSVLRQYDTISQCMAALFWGLLGGLAALYFHATQATENDKDSTS